MCRCFRQPSGSSSPARGSRCLPRYVEVLMPGNLRAVAVTRPTLEYPVVAVRLAKHPLNPAAMAFLAMVRQHMKPPRIARP